MNAILEKEIKKNDALFKKFLDWADGTWFQYQTPHETEFTCGLMKTKNYHEAVRFVIKKQAKFGLDLLSGFYVAIDAFCESFATNKEEK